MPMRGTRLESPQTGPFEAFQIDVDVVDGRKHEVVRLVSARPDEVLGVVIVVVDCLHRFWFWNFWCYCRPYMVIGH